MDTIAILTQMRVDLEEDLINDGSIEIGSVAWDKAVEKNKALAEAITSLMKTSEN
tara:strand:+ start:817 stop:981 length:165 start_codon:yes stop_codon:yes gene_type:complete